MRNARTRMTKDTVNINPNRKSRLSKKDAELGFRETSTSKSISTMRNEKTVIYRIAVGQSGKSDLVTI
jgi:hypothetical protein